MCGRHQTQKAQRLLLTTVCFSGLLSSGKKIHCSEEFACEDQMQRKIDGEFVSFCCCTLIHLHSASQLQDNKRPCSAGYDMQFDIKYAYFNLLESLAAIV